MTERDRDGVAELTRIVRGLLAYAVGGVEPIPSPAQGRACPHPGFGGDPVYNAVTEGRHARAIKSKQFYSSCGDLAHWLLFRMGVRSSWVNRAELDGWHFGERAGARWDNNVTTLCARQKYGTNALAVVPDPADFHLACGDVLVVNAHDPQTTHVLVVYEHQPDEQFIVTAEYGQPGGALRAKHYAIEGGRIKLGLRWLDSVLPLFDVIETAKSVNERRAIETAEEWATRLGLPAPETP